DGFRLGGARPDPDVDLVMVGNPTNPTSRLHDPEDIAALATDSTSPERLVVVDEAFLDVVEEPAEPAYSLARRAATDRRLVVIRSLTKTYSIAGLRIGYVVAHPDVVRRLTRCRSPWPVGTLALAAAEACVSDEGSAHAAALRAELPGRLRHLCGGLAARGFEVVAEPRAPFVLARHDRGAELRAQLRARGIAVRRGDTFPGLDGGWVRVAARSTEVTDVLLRALADLADLPGPTSGSHRGQRTPHE
ncbi:aminotransferase class I/II-fold pyridoxal phosphate-dependent enzyme, partial [Nocardioides sp.]|uniref:aminotransferase class I/II-fold pyridoxal phosphate-dependent enzyme n=1 Tax=Nocardioides sp. TaxID=35761 RepID=UPI002735F3E5